MEQTAAPLSRPSDHRSRARRGFVFISFKTEEVETARRLRDALDAEGYAVWWQAEIQCGQEWHGELDRAVSNAACIIVLWSERAMDSIWVRHEASQAIARHVYAPARVEAIAVPPPYNRTQASDLVGWDGDTTHPGYVGLLQLVDRLAPEAQTVGQRIVNALNRSRTTIAALTFAVVAVGLLVSVASRLNSQVSQMQTLVGKSEGVASDVQRLLNPIEGFTVSGLIQVDPTIGALTPYRDRVFNALRKEGHTIGPWGVDSAEGVIANTTSGVRFAARQGSWLFPTPQESVAYQLATNLQLQVRFYRDSPGTPVVPRRAADYAMRVFTRDLPAINTHMEFRLDPESLAVSFREAAAAVQKTGRIFSVDDLEKAELWISIEDFLYDPKIMGAAADAERAEIRKALRIESLHFTVSGQDFVLRRDGLEERATPDGLHFYVGRLASSDSTNNPIEDRAPERGSPSPSRRRCPCSR